MQTTVAILRKDLPRTAERVLPEHYKKTLHWLNHAIYGSILHGFFASRGRRRRSGDWKTTRSGTTITPHLFADLDGDTMTTDAAGPVWFITGCSTGFGRELARHTLGLGYPTVVTARNPAQVADLVAGREDQSLVLTLDVTDPAQIEAAVAAAQARFGRIDVLVNNAGVGYFGSFEESDLAAVRSMLEINVWGLVNLTRAVLPGMRQRRSGALVNLSSVGGLVAFPALSFYNASKFAVEALSESLAQELAPLGIRVLLVEPGPFRTDWAGRSADEAPRTIPDYDATAGARTQMIRGYSGQQPGDPKRAAATIVQTLESDHPPLRLLLGKMALDAAAAKLTAMKAEFDGWAAVSIAADYPEAKP
jgi:NAD(P)-dependent dehydrogenase (short-subunit alcohol dehydrogenase family)